MLFLFLQPLSARADYVPKILVLHSYHQGYQWTDDVNTGITSLFSQHQPNTELYIEYMNSKRFSTETVFPLLRRTYARLFRSVRFDLIIASDNNALDFLLKYRDELFPNAAVVFCGINNWEAYDLGARTGYTGVRENIDIASTIDLALRLHPHTRTVALLADVTETGQINLRLARKAAERFKAVRFIELNSLSSSALKQALGTLKRDSVILNLSFFRDANGHSFSAQESTKFIAASTNLPVYTLWDFYLGPGVVGGRLVSGRLQGEAAATIALRILAGEKPDGIPVQESPTAFFLDYEMLEKFAVHPSLIPADSIILGKPQTFYARYNAYIWFTAALFIFQSIIIVLLVRTIRGRRKADAALRTSESKFSSLVDNLNVGIYRMTVETDGRFVQVNPALAKMFGFGTVEAFLDRRDVELYQQSEDRNLFMKEVFQKGFVKDRELALKKQDGTPMWASVSANVKADDKGDIQWIDGVVEDITEKKKLEEQLLQSHKMEAVGTLAGGVAHDFNNILTAIIGYASLLRLRWEGDHPDKAFVDDILSAAGKATNLTQGLLAFSRKQPISPQELDINDVVKAIDKLLMRLIGEDIEFKIVLADDPLPVLADCSQMEQVLMNLAANARDSMPCGGVLTITTERVDIAEQQGFMKPGSYAVLSVTDSGEGMDETTRHRIFEPFYTTKDKGKGTGLGLSIVYGIVKRHNGEITVYSEQGLGTTFKIYLRLRAADIKRTEPLTPLTAVGGTETILLAEDDALVRKLLKGVLEEYGYTVIEASDGEDALVRFKENKDRIQLLVLDLVMPKKTGREVYEELKKRAPGIRAIFTSGYAGEIVRKKELLEKGVPFLSKPVTPQTLLCKVREVLDA